MKRLTTDTGLTDYFWSLVDKNGPLPEKSTGVKSHCWLWIGSIRQDGYGRFNFEGRIYSPTRFAWKLKTGRYPGSFAISTHCQNKTCVRHLFSRTRSDLGKATGGHPGFLGEDHPNAKLTTKQVLQIRELYATGKFQQKELAARLNVSRASLRKVARKQSWGICEQRESAPTQWSAGRNGHACAWFDHQGVLSQSLMVFGPDPSHRTLSWVRPRQEERAPDSVAMADRVPRRRPDSLPLNFGGTEVEDEHVATNPTSTPCPTTPTAVAHARRRRNVGPLLSRHLIPGPGCGYTIALGQCEQNILNEAQRAAPLCQKSSSSKIVAPSLLLWHGAPID
jgi:hypothetical protein